MDVQHEVSPLQTKWNNTMELIAQDIIVMCASVNALRKQLPEFFCKSSLHLGSLLNSVARYDMADELHAWFRVELQQVWVEI